jgi:hypothetical protein
MRVPTPAVAIAILILATACHSPTSPSDGKTGSTVVDHGRLSGIVTIGPNCPGAESTTNPCAAQPSAYAARKILVYNEAHTNLLFTVDIDSQGAYLIDLAPAMYTIDLKPNGMDRTFELPKVIEIKTNVVTRLDVNIDTGIR